MKYAYSFFPLRRFLRHSHDSATCEVAMYGSEGGMFREGVTLVRHSLRYPPSNSVRDCTSFEVRLDVVALNLLSSALIVLTQGTVLSKYFIPNFRLVLPQSMYVFYKNAHSRNGNLGAII